MPPMIAFLDAPRVKPTPPGAMQVALRIPISTPGWKCRPIAAANSEGDSDAHYSFGNVDNRSDFGCSSGARPDIRRRISGLPACLRPDHLLCVQLYVDSSLQRVVLRPL